MAAQKMQRPILLSWILETAHLLLRVYTGHLKWFQSGLMRIHCVHTASGLNQCAFELVRSQTTSWGGLNMDWSGLHAQAYHDHVHNWVCAGLRTCNTELYLTKRLRTQYTTVGSYKLCSTGLDGQRTRQEPWLPYRARKMSRVNLIRLQGTVSCMSA